jgi:prevent-host-death family protein
MTWQLQQAQAQFGELLDATIKEGPQIVTRDGIELAVLVPIDEWKRLHPAPTDATQTPHRPTLKDILLAPTPIVEDMMIPERGHLRHRETPEF